MNPTDDSNNGLTIPDSYPTAPTNPPRLSDDHNVLALYAQVDPTTRNWQISCDGTALGDDDPSSETIDMTGRSKVILMLMDPPGFELEVCSTWKNSNSQPVSTNGGVEYPRAWKSRQVAPKSDGVKYPARYSYAALGNLLPDAGGDGDGDGDQATWDIDIAFIATDLSSGEKSRCDPVFKIKVQRPSGGG